VPVKLALLDTFSLKASAGAFNSKILTVHLSLESLVPTASMDIISSKEYAFWVILSVPLLTSILALA
jgi:hypothetical protein